MSRSLAASISIATAVISAMEDIPVDQSIAMTGSLSIRGNVLPIGGVTAKVEAGEMARYRHMGVLGVIVKPFDPMILSRQIEEIWQRHRSS